MNVRGTLQPVVMCLALAATGCATARLLSSPPPPPPSARPSAVLVVEPFFEVSKWRITDRAEPATVMPLGYGSPLGYGGLGGSYYPGYGGFGPADATVYRQVADKPPVSRVPALAAEQQEVIREVQRMRPNWQVVSTAALSGLTGPVELVRVIVGEDETIGSDRTMKDFLTAIGLGIPAFFFKIHETQRIVGGMVKYGAEAESLRTHLLRYPSQPDFAVDTRGLSHTDQPFALDVDYEEGVFAPIPPRDQVVVQAFAHKLAVAVVALVEGVK